MAIKNEYNVAEMMQNHFLFNVAMLMVKDWMEAISSHNSDSFDGFDDFSDCWFSFVNRKDEYGFMENHPYQQIVYKFAKKIIEADRD
jgi:hypothetical protein